MELTKKLGKTLLGAGLAISFGLAITVSNQALAQGACIAAPSGLIGWWDADSISGVTAFDIQDGNDGTMVGGVGIVSGQVDNAFSFDGVDDFVQLEFDSGIFTNAFTIDAWAFPTKLREFGFLQGILDNDKENNPGGRGITLNVFGGVGVVPFTLDARFGNADGAFFVVSAPTTPDVFHHYAVTYDGSFLCLYQDGVQEDCVSASGNTIANGLNFRIGHGQAQDGSQNRYFGGLIDEVEIFNRALTAAEIQAIYDAGSAGKCKTAALDIKPGSFPNAVNLCAGGGVTPLALIGSESFDPNEFVVTEVRVGDDPISAIGKGKKEVCVIDDVTGDFPDGEQTEANPGGPDELDDLVCHVPTVDLRNSGEITDAEDTEMTVCVGLCPIADFVEGSCLVTPEEICATDSVKISRFCEVEE